MQRLRATTFSFFILTALATLTGCPSEPSTPSTSSSSSSGGGNSNSSFACKGKPEVGQPASAFSLPAMNGAGKVAVQPGKVTLIDFWATWCGPCQKSFPKYQELYVKYKSSGLEIAAVSVDNDDDKGKIPGFAKTYEAKFPVGWDEGHKIADCYKPPNMPSAYVVDKKGVIRFVHNGYKGDEEAKKLEEEIKGLL
jgi:cytochrome c biogenesis protein CcmG, thiol:disulfide interchange protein DsbE